MGGMAPARAQAPLATRVLSGMLTQKICQACLRVGANVVPYVMVKEFST